jgi:hypothetical protein
MWISKNQPDLAGKTNMAIFSVVVNEHVRRDRLLPHAATQVILLADVHG